MVLLTLVHLYHCTLKSVFDPKILKIRVKKYGVMNPTLG